MDMSADSHIVAGCSALFSDFLIIVEPSWSIKEEAVAMMGVSILFILH